MKLNLLFNFLFFIPFLTIYFYILIFFFKISTVFSKNFIKDKLRNLGGIKSFFFQNYININILTITYICIYLFLNKGFNSNLFFKNIYVNNFNLFMVLMLFMLIILIIYIFKNLFFQKINYPKEYFFSILNIIVISPILFFTNNLFSFIFLLELLSVLIFFKLTVSKINKKTNFLSNKNLFFSKKYLSLLFFQFWVTFFSTIMLFFFLNSILVLLGSSNFFLINFLLKVNLYQNIFDIFFLNLISVFFLIFFFFKLGTPPIQLFKIEIYESIPFISILFFTTFYISFFFLFFVYLVCFLIPSVFLLSHYCLLLLLVFGSVYMISFLYNIFLIKSFFAYSTLINIVNFIYILIIII